MKTVITITFDGTMSKEKLNELLGDLHAQCSEDSEGSSWTDGSFEIETQEVK